MAAENPTGDPRVVPVDLPTDQKAILGEDLLGWLAGIEEDLGTAQAASDPGALGREADAFRRLLDALDTGRIELPDEEACSALEHAARGYDEASGYERIVAVHDAHQALLAILGGGQGR